MSKFNTMVARYVYHDVLGQHGNVMTQDHDEHEKIREVCRKWAVSRGWDWTWAGPILEISYGNGECYVLDQIADPIDVSQVKTWHAIRAVFLIQSYIHFDQHPQAWDKSQWSSTASNKSSTQKDTPEAD